MPLKNSLNTFKTIIVPAILNSYSVIFFFNNKLLASMLLIVSFFNVQAGISGLLAVLIAVFIASSMNFDKVQLKSGFLSFNALLTGIGMGTFFEPSLVFYSILAFAALLTLILTVTIGGWLRKYGLPVLSIPFVLTFWFIVLPSSQFENLGLTQRNIFWINDMYALGGNSLLNFFQTIDSLPIHNLVDIYFRSISSIFFQDNLITGLLIAIVLLISSRIAFSLSVIGFLSAYFFAQFTGSAAASITYYNIGANYIMVALAIGGYFTIPSRYSYLWTILLVPVTSMVLLFLNKLVGFISLPVFSLPFSLVVIFFIYFLQFRTKQTKLILTPIQHNSPELNLYAFKNNAERNAHFQYFPFLLPFWGEWTVSQGNDGKYTHKGEWGKALDFVIQDDELKTYKGAGLLCEDYYCYNKPVLASADGIVEEIIDNVDDNEIGKVDTKNNWGNTIIVRHLTGLYTQTSHLKKASFKVSKGDFVKCGDILALCGNSGRSPEPHIHFQVQISPLLGAKTINYPIAYFFNNKQNETSLREFAIPSENDKVAKIINSISLKKAFDIIPNSVIKFRYSTNNDIDIIEEWEAFTDAYNQKYLYCKSTDSYAYFITNASMFYFTSFYGNKKSLLYYFYLSAFKIFFGESEGIEVFDAMPLNTVNKNRISIWLHDFIAPFHNYISVKYSIIHVNDNQLLEKESINLKSRIFTSTFGRNMNESQSEIVVKDGKVVAFSFQNTKIKIKAECIDIV